MRRRTCTGITKGGHKCGNAVSAIGNAELLCHRHRKSPRPLDWIFTDPPNAREPILATIVDTRTPAQVRPRPIEIPPPEPKRIRHEPPPEAQNYNVRAQEAQNYNVRAQEAQNYNVRAQEAQNYNVRAQEAQNYNVRAQEAQNYNVRAQEAQNYNVRAQEAQNYNAPMRGVDPEIVEAMRTAVAATAELVEQSRRDLEKLIDCAIESYASSHYEIILDRSNGVIHADAEASLIEFRTTVDEAFSEYVKYNA